MRSVEKRTRRRSDRGGVRVEERGNDHEEGEGPIARALELSRRKHWSDCGESEGAIAKRVSSDRSRENAEKLLSFQLAFWWRGVNLVGWSDQA